jgi:hypothetical protein
VSQSIVCVHCGKPLIDAEHAKKHVVTQCPNSPAGKLRDVLVQLHHEMQIAKMDWDARAMSEYMDSWQKQIDDALMAVVGRKIT